MRGESLDFVSCNDRWNKCGWFFNSYITTLCSAGAETFLSWHAVESFAVEKKGGNERGRERLSATFHFVSVLERKDRAGSGDRGHALMSIWVNLIGYPSVLAKPCWEEVMWEDETLCDRWEVPASDLFSGGWRCDSSQSRREKGWVELMVRISVSILTSSLRG